MGALFSSALDSRPRPQIPTAVVVRAVFLMMAARMGSLHALEQEQANRGWPGWLGAVLPSADTVGRVFARMALESLRLAIRTLYGRFRRNKVLGKTHGHSVLIVDGHESSSSYFRCCPGCLERILHTHDGDRVQFYHRDVLAMLSGERFPFLLDVEPQRKGEDEVSCALRLLGRVLRDYPRAFDLVVADGLYLKAPFFHLLLDHGKDLIVVLKDERRDLLQDAQGIFRLAEPVVLVDGNVERRMWDIEGFDSWTSLRVPVRVVRSVETRSIQRQRTGVLETVTSEWIWATTLTPAKTPTLAVVHLGHDRWLIENRAIREMVTYWHADHVYRHHPQAITAFLLILMLTLNLFRAFLSLNIKPCLRARHTQLYFARLLAAGLYEERPEPVPP